MKKKIYAFIKNILVLLIIGVPQLYLVINDKPWQINMIILVSTTIILVFWNFEKFAELTLKKDGLSIKLKQAVKEAYATIDFVKDAMAPIIKLQTDLIKTAGTFDTISAERHVEIIEELESATLALGLKEETVRLVNETKNRLVIQARSEIHELYEKIFGKDRFSFKQHLIESNINEIEEYKELAKEIDNISDREKWNSLVSILEKNK
ncbi:hypothetical protein [Enterococcus sp. UD-01]|jgi:hypothetical protein|uniref:hypothetical protein n=1 Tax=Enterococcus sp. UD-01 TaxID=3373911 RepID=UPI003839C2B1